MSTNINSTEQIVEINAGDQITNVNIVSQSTTQIISGEQVVTVDVNAGTIPAAWGSITGTLSNQTDLQNALNAKQNNITLTTTGSTGVATLVGSTLNIPNYVSSTKQTQWDSAYNDKINSAEVSGTTTKTLTLTQQDGGIIQASWSDYDTAPVTSVFGRTGNVVSAEGDYNINQLGDVTITSATNGQVLKYNGTTWVNAADASGLTSVGLTVPTGLSVSGSPLTSNGTINVGLQSGYSIPTTAKQAEWDQAYNDKINSASVTGNSTKTLTLTQQDGGTVTTSWTDQGLTSVGLAMPSAFTVSGSPLTSNGTITVTGAGTTSQYVRGDGSLATFPTTSNEAKTLIREVYNSTGATLTKGTVVYINGGQGNLPTVTKAIASGDQTSAQTFGIVQSDITNMNNGFVVIAGGIDNLDTQAYTVGTALYLSPTTAGAFTSTKPYAPNHLVYLGVVVRSHPTQGVIEVKIQNGYELDELHNVSARFPTNKDGLFYNSTSNVWENKSIAGVLGYTPVPESRIITINGTAQDLSADRTYNVGTVTSIAASGGTGISISGSPVTGSGTISIVNTAPDQTVTITPSGLATVSGTYPNFTVGVSTAYSGSVTSVNASVPTGFEVSGVPITTAGTIDIKFASGYSLPTTAKQTQWDDAYTKRINSLTVTGNSGSSTLVSNVLNVPTYTLSGLGGEPAITAGTSLQYWRGDKTFQTLNTGVVPESGNVYFTEPRVRATVLSGLNITGGSISASDSVLDAFGKVQNQINGLMGGSIFQSTWNASTNSPTLTSSVGTKGYYYIVSVAGSTNLNGITDWQIGDWAIFDGTVWRKVDNTDAVVSVNGFTGTVSLGISNLADVSATSPTDTQLLRFNGTTSKWYNWTPNYEPALTKGNLTEATSSVLTITGGSNAVIGSGTTIQVKQASGSQSGFLSSTDWTTFNNKQNALTNPVTGTGTLNYVAKFNATGSTIANSQIFDDGTSVSIGSTVISSKFTVFGGTSSAGSSTSSSAYTIAANDPTTMAAGVGGSILFQGYKTGTSAIGNFAYIAGKKENGTGGDESGVFVAGTFNSSGTPTEALRISSASYATFTSGISSKDITIRESGSGSLTIQRQTYDYTSLVNFNTTSTSKWSIGLLGNATDNYYIYNQGLNAAALVSSFSTNDITVNYKLGVNVTPSKRLDVYDANSSGTDDIVRAYQGLAANHAWYRSQRNTGANMVIGATRDNVDGNIPANSSVVWNQSTHNMAFGTDNALRFTLTSGGTLNYTSGVTASSSIARAVYINPTLIAAANNDVLIGLDIRPTYTIGAYTNIENVGLRVMASDNRWLKYSQNAVSIKLNDNSNAIPLYLENTLGSGYAVGMVFNLGYGGTGSSVGTAIAGGRILVNPETSWTSTASTQDANMVFYVAQDGVLGDGLTINSNKTIRLNGYSADGFVKTSGGVGQLTIDTTSYQPLLSNPITGSGAGNSGEIAYFTGATAIGGTSAFTWSSPTMTIGLSAASNNTDYKLTIQRHGTLANPGTWTSADSVLRVLDYAADGPATFDSQGAISFEFPRISTTDTNAANATLFRVALDNIVSLAINGKGNTFLGQSAATDSGDRLQVSGSGKFTSSLSATQYTATSTGGSGLRVYGGSGTNQWDVYLNSTNLRFSDNTGTGSVVFDRPISGTSATFSGQITSTKTSGTILGATSATTGSSLLEIGNTSGYLIMGVNNSAGGNVMTTSAYASYIFTHTSTDLVLGTNDIARLTINTSGNVGIGCSPSSWVSTAKAIQLPSFASVSQQHNGSLNLMSSAYESSASSFVYADTGTYPVRINLNPNDGSITFLNNASTSTAGSALTFSERLKITSGGNIQISTNNVALVQTNAAGTGTIGIARVTSGNNLQIGDGGTANPTYVYFPNGSVGINTTTVNAKLQINDSTVSSGGSAIWAYGYDGAANLYTTRGEAVYNTALYLYNNPSAGQGYGTGISFRAKSDTTDSRAQGIIYTTWSTATDASRTSNMVFGTTNAGSTSDKMWLLGNGHLGVGQSSPSARLHVTTTGITAAAPSLGWPIYNAESDASAKQIILDTAGNGGVSTAGYGATVCLVLGQYYDSRVVITPQGNGGGSPGDQGQGRGKDLMLKAGTSDNGVGYKGGRLYLNGGMGYQSAYNANGGDIIMQGLTGSGNVGVGAAPSGTYKLEISGSVAASSGFYDTSDFRIKNILERNPNIKLDIDLIKYTKKDDQYNSIRYGYIAQEVQKYIPDLVKGTDTLSLNYQDIHSILIYNLMKRIKELESKLN